MASGNIRFDFKGKTAILTGAGQGIGRAVALAFAKAGMGVAAADIDSGVRDTTGAGDAFQGGFLYGFLKGWEVKKSATFANACGYLKSLKVGARNMPRFEEVERFLKTKGWTRIG